MNEQAKKIQFYLLYIDYRNIVNWNPYKNGDDWWNGENNVHLSNLLYASILFFIVSYDNTPGGEIDRGKISNLL